MISNMAGSCLFNVSSPPTQFKSQDVVDVWRHRNCDHAGNAPAGVLGGGILGAILAGPVGLIGGALLGGAMAGGQACRPDAATSLPPSVVDLAKRLDGTSEHLPMGASKRSVILEMLREASPE